MKWVILEVDKSTFPMAWLDFPGPWPPMRERGSHPSPVACPQHQVPEGPHTCAWAPLPMAPPHHHGHLGSRTKFPHNCSLVTPGARVSVFRKLGMGGEVAGGGAQYTVSQSLGSPIPSVCGVGWGEATQALGKYVLHQPEEAVLCTEGRGHRKIRTGF